MGILSTCGGPGCCSCWQIVNVPRAGLLVNRSLEQAKFQNKPPKKTQFLSLFWSFVLSSFPSFLYFFLFKKLKKKKMSGWSAIPPDILSVICSYLNNKEGKIRYFLF